jgi:predicted CXXCH cytochrome family protein
MLRKSRWTQWIHAHRLRLLWLSAGAYGLALALLSCGTLDSNRGIVAPPSVPGAQFIGMEKCANCHEEIVRDFATATHARLKAPGANATNTGCESCHGPGSLHAQAGGAANLIVNPRKSPQACFACHLDVRSQFQLPHHHPVLEGNMTCTDCHEPHKGKAMKGAPTGKAERIHGGGMAFLTENENCLQCHTAQRGPYVFEHEAMREGCTVCHRPHGSVNQRLLTERNQTLCLKCHFERQTSPGSILIGNVDHSFFLPQGTCWSAGCHEEPHGSNVTPFLRY